MSQQANPDPFADPAFLEGLEAAGYLQRLDTSEARITARYQHALKKIEFAKHSEEFLTRAGVRRVHGSTVQFFNERPVSDPFVHVLVGSLPPSRQALVTPVGAPTSGWTPIESPDEADGTIHFTVSYPGYWPLTVVFDSNAQDLPGENRWAAADSESDSENDFYNNAGRGGGGSASGRTAGDAAFGRALTSGRSGRSGRTSDAYGGGDDDGYGSSRGGGGAAGGGRSQQRSASQSRAQRNARNAYADSGSDSGSDDGGAANAMYELGLNSGRGGGGSATRTARSTGGSQSGRTARAGSRSGSTRGY